MVNSLLLQELYPNLFSSVILMDPAIAKAEDASARYRMERIITQYTWSRQDTWRNRKEARKALETQEGSRYWHPKVMDAYLVGYALSLSFFISSERFSGEGTSIASGVQASRAFYF
jgi:hypothetical protein